MNSVIFTVLVLFFLLNYLLSVVITIEILYLISFFFVCLFYISKLLGIVVYEIYSRILPFTNIPSLFFTTTNKIDYHKMTSDELEHLRLNGYEINVNENIAIKYEFKTLDAKEQIVKFGLRIFFLIFLLFSYSLRFFFRFSNWNFVLIFFESTFLVILHLLRTSVKWTSI